MWEETEKRNERYITYATIALVVVLGLVVGGVIK